MNVKKKEVGGTQPLVGWANPRHSIQRKKKNKASRINDFDQHYYSCIIILKLKSELERFFNFILLRARAWWSAG